MTSTPVSLNDESLNGSWIDINSASQIHSPMDTDSPEFLNPPYSLAESAQSLGIISFQVERFLQEAQRNQNSSNSLQNLQQNATTSGGIDDNSGIYLSDSDLNSDTGPDGIAMMNNLRKYQQHKKRTLSNNESNNNINNNDPQRIRTPPTVKRGSLEFSINGDAGQLDQLSDSLSLLSRASALDDQSMTGGILDRTAEDFQDFEWLWDWTAQPEYFSKEWKLYTSKQDYLTRQRQLYCANLNNRSYGGTLFSGEVISLLFLTNILSIIIGAGLTYSILMRKS